MGFACEELTQGTSASRKMEEMYFSLLPLSAMKTPGHHIESKHEKIEI